MIFVFFSQVFANTSLGVFDRRMHLRLDHDRCGGRHGAYDHSGSIQHGGHRRSAYRWPSPFTKSVNDRISDRRAGACIPWLIARRFRLLVLDRNLVEKALNTSVSSDELLATGAFCGWKGAIFAIFGGAMLGALVRFRLWLSEVRITAKKTPKASLGAGSPFGPYLALAGLLYLIIRSWGRRRFHRFGFSGLFLGLTSLKTFF